tara:strand:+ start:20007 stop:20576 length:570 start_codon:yes stop_codon:yes gene_type:complete
MKNLIDKLVIIQGTLKAPKNQTNNFGKYKYRSCEDIFEAVKPHLTTHNLYLSLSDELVNIGDRYYVKATANITDGKDSLTVSAYAREEENKKGMDGSQITGTSSSYARKYAMNGMFAIDDNKDSDHTNTGEKVEPIQDNKLSQLLNVALAEIKVIDNLDKLKNIWVAYPMLQQNESFKNSINNRKLDFK